MTNFNELEQLTGEERKAFLAYITEDINEKTAKANKAEMKPGTIALIKAHGTPKRKNETTTITQASYRDDYTLHTLQLEECDKETLNNVKYIAYLEQLLADNGIAHLPATAQEFIKIVHSDTIRVLTADSTKKSLRK